eukprot:scaffold43515_cov78-Cyclotella_meneghiniana.AAC.1
MKLTIASVFIASLSAPSVSSSIVVASIREHESKQGSIRPSASKNKECTFEDGFEVNLRETSDDEVPPCENGELYADKDTAWSPGGTKKSSGDVGILSCEIGELCAEDSTSSLGGRCVSVSSNIVALGPQRERDLECEKCKGETLYGYYYPACVGVSDLDKANIACGSCHGEGACNNLESGVTIGANSCVTSGANSCYSASVILNLYVLTNPNLAAFNSAMGVWRAIISMAMINGDELCMHEYPEPVTSSPSSAPVTSSPTAVPVTPSPSAAPVTPSPMAAQMSTPGWNIIYDSMKMDLTADTTEELIFLYNISSTRAYEYDLFEKDCSTEIRIGDNLMTSNWTSSETNSDGTDRLALFYDINMTAVPSSPIWNPTSEDMEICVVLNLVEPAT